MARIFESNPHSRIDNKLKAVRLARKPTSKRATPQRVKHAALGKHPGKNGSRTLSVIAMKKRLSAASRLD